MLISSYKKELSNLAPPPNFGLECMILSLSHHEKCRFSRSEYPSSSYLRIPFMHRNLRRRWRREERNYCHCSSFPPHFSPGGKFQNPFCTPPVFEKGFFSILPIVNSFLPRDASTQKHRGTLNLLPCILTKKRSELFFRTFLSNLLFSFAGHSTKLESLLLVSGLLSWFPAALGSAADNNGQLLLSQQRSLGWDGKEKQKRDKWRGAKNLSLFVVEEEE